MSKPILSELEYNADDVASAILQQADLSIANEDLGVGDISDKFSFQNSYNQWYDFQCYSFMGFVFVSFGCYKNASTVSSGDVIASISDSDYHPSTDMNLQTIGYEGDLAERIYLATDGDIKVAGPVNAGSDNNFYILVNGWYRHTSV